MSQLTEQLLEALRRVATWDAPESGEPDMQDLLRSGLIAEFGPGRYVITPEGTEVLREHDPLLTTWT